MNGSHILKNTIPEKKSNIIAPYSNAFTLCHTTTPHMHTYIPKNPLKPCDERFTFKLQFRCHRFESSKSAQQGEKKRSFGYFRLKVFA